MQLNVKSLQGPSLQAFYVERVVESLLATFLRAIDGELEPHVVAH